MKKNELLYNVLLVLGVICLLTNCSTDKKDWEVALSKNSILGYKQFAENHPKSNYRSKANRAIDSIIWMNVFLTNRIDSIQQFYKKHPENLFHEKTKRVIDSLTLGLIIKSDNKDSIENYYNMNKTSDFFVQNKAAVDSIKWIIAKLSNDSVILKKYILDYPNSANSQKAKSLLEQKKAHSLVNYKANSVAIYSKGSGIIYGEKMFALNDGGSSTMVPGGRNQIYIWRDFGVNEVSGAKEQGIKQGVAYLYKNGKFKFIKVVDLRKSDNDLCKEFDLN